LYCSVLVCREGWSAAYRCKVRSRCAGRGAPHSRIVSRRRTVEQAGTVGRLPSMRQRRAWARAVQRLFEAFSGCSPWWQSPPPLLRLPTAPVPRGHLGLPARAAGHCGDPGRGAAAHLGHRPPAAQEVPHRAERLATVRRRPHGGSTGRAAASVQLHRPPRRLTVIARLSLDCSRWMRPITWSTSPASPGSRRFPFPFRAPLGAGGRARWWPWVHPDPTGLMSAWCPPTTPRDSADAVRAPWLCSIPTWMASSTTSPADFPTPHHTQHDNQPTAPLDASCTPPTLSTRLATGFSIRHNG
jgi:hypothetical protein